MDNNQQAHEHNNGPVMLLSDDTFVNEVLEADMPVLVDFKAEWCGPCKFMAPIFTGMAPEYKDRVKFAKLDVDESPGVAGALQIESIPTLMLFYKNNLLNIGVGAMRQPDLEKWIEEGLERMSQIPAEDEAESEASEPPTES